MDDGLSASGSARLLHRVQIVTEQGSEAFVILGRFERLKDSHGMGILEENLFPRGVENDKSGVDIPQNIGENAGGVAEGAFQEGRFAVSAGQQSVEKLLYQEKHTVGRRKQASDFPTW
jgi:hypothetical protein